VCVAISAAAPEIVSFVYGDKWLPAADILRWLAILAAFRIFFELVYDYLVVVQRSTAILVIQVAWLFALVPGIVFAVHEWGSVGVAATLVVVSAVVSVPMYLVELRRAGVSPKPLAGALAAPLVASGTLIGFAVLVSASVASVLLVLLLIGVAALATVAVLLIQSRRELAVFRVRTA
jgi:PST family polysaccharide transporter